jgi:type II secretion system protein J
MNKIKILVRPFTFHLSPFTNNGFTLLEIIVSITILAAMMLSITQISTGLSKARDKSSERLENQHSLILVLTKLSDDLRTAFNADKKFWGKDDYYRTGFIGDETSLNFSTMSNVHRIENHRDTNQAVVGYSLERQDDGNYRLLRRSTDTLVEQLEEGGTPYVLLTDLKELTFSYYDANQKEWQSSWDTDSVTTMGKLPKQVKVQLVLALADENDDNEAKRKTFELLIPVEMYDRKISF